jgi:hypothetical protein
MDLLIAGQHVQAEAREASPQAIKTASQRLVGARLTDVAEAIGPVVAYRA